MEYIITNGKTYISLDRNCKQTTGNQLHRAVKFESKQKAENYLRNLKSTLKRFDWHIESVKNEDLKTENEDSVAFVPDLEIDIDIDLQDLIDNIKVLHIKSKNLDSKKEKIEEELEIIEQERCDIDHAIEFIKFNAAQGYKLARMLQDLRLKRRRLKNELAVIEILLQSNIQDCISNKIMPRLNGLDKRKYTPRVLAELFNMAS